jgi:hypothetical protein
VDGRYLQGKTVPATSVSAFSFSPGNSSSGGSPVARRGLSGRNAASYSGSATLDPDSLASCVRSLARGGGEVGRNFRGGFTLEDPGGHPATARRDLVADDRFDRGGRAVDESVVEVGADPAARSGGRERMAAAAVVDEQLLAASVGRARGSRSS